MAKKKSKKPKNLIKETLEKTQNIRIIKKITASRVRKNQSLYREVIPIEEYEQSLSKTRQQQFDFDSYTLSDEVSKKKKNKTQKVVIKKVYPKFLISALMIMIVMLSGFITIHYITFNHHKVKVVEKIKIKKEKKILFLGDSITDYYNLNDYYDMDKHYIINSGVGGNTTGDILDDLDRRAFQYKPDVVFLLIGTNDIECQIDDDQIVSNIKAIVEKILEKFPKCKIYVESIYPVNRSKDDKINLSIVGKRRNSIIQKINEEIKKYCEEKSITYLDIYDILSDEDDQLVLDYTKEGLHISDEGYKVITKELKKYIDKE